MKNCTVENFIELSTGGFLSLFLTVISIKNLGKFGWKILKITVDNEEFLQLKVKQI